jgi:hypothetical protein
LRVEGEGARKNISLLLTCFGFEWLLLGWIRFAPVVQRRDASATFSGCDGRWHFLQSPGHFRPPTLFFPVTKLQSYIIFDRLRVDFSAKLNFVTGVRARRRVRKNIGSIRF